MKRKYSSKHAISKKIGSSERFFVSSNMSIQSMPKRLQDDIYTGGSYPSTMFSQSVQSLNLFQTSPPQLQFILEHLDNGIVAQNASGVFLYANPKAAQLLGFSSTHHLLEHLRSSSHITSPEYSYKDTLGKTIQERQWPWQKISPDTPHSELVVNICTMDETFQRRIQINSYTVYGTRKEEELIISTITDITHIAQLEKQKDEFMSLASHELKTPITSMKIFTQTLMRVFEKKKDPKSMYYLGKIEGQLNKLTMLVREMLEVSRLQTGRLQFHREEFAIGELIQEVCQHMQFTTENHTITYTLREERKLFADRERIGQVLINLLGNAIKYSPANTHIRVICNADSTSVMISVIDEGIGISEERQEYIFDRFTKNTDEKESTFPGMGVGLYIASEIIKRHNGTIGVKSKKGKGATFTVTIPIGNA